MRIYNRYLLTLTTTTSVSAVVLIGYGVRDLGAYLSTYTIESLVLGAFFMHLHPRARRVLGRLNVVLFVLFLAVAAQKALSFLLGLGSPGGRLF